MLKTILAGLVLLVASFPALADYPAEWIQDELDGIESVILTWCEKNPYLMDRVTPSSRPVVGDGSAAAQFRDRCGAALHGRHIPYSNLTVFYRLEGNGGWRQRGVLGVVYNDQIQVELDGELKEVETPVLFVNIQVYTFARHRDGLRRSKEPYVALYDVPAQQLMRAHFDLNEPFFQYFSEGYLYWDTPNAEQYIEMHDLNDADDIDFAYEQADIINEVGESAYRHLRRQVQRLQDIPPRGAVPNGF